MSSLNRVTELMTLLNHVIVEFDRATLKAVWEDPFEEDEEATVESLVDLVDAQRSLLISVATGGPRIEEVESTYKKRHRRLKAGLDRHGVAAPFKWNSLWDWYGYYSGKLSTYAERRSYVNELADVAIDQLTSLATRGVTDLGTSPETWGTLDARLEELKSLVPHAKSVDDLQDIGRRAREIIIGAVNLVFREDMVSSGAEVPKGADAKNRLDVIMESLVPGTAHAELRKVMRGSLELAHKVTHSENITRVVVNGRQGF